MTLALLAIYAFSCAALLWDGWQRRNPFVELTFLCGAGSAIVLLPQGLGLALAGDLVPAAALAKAFAMAALSNFALLAGWRRHVPAPAPPAPRPRELTLRRAFCWGVLLTFVGLASSLALARLSGGILGQFASGGAYSVEWRGMPVVWVFFVSFLMPGIALTALTALGLRSRLRLSLPLAASILPLAWVLLLYRRNVAAALLTTASGVLWFASRRALPRWMAPALLLGGFMAAFLFPALRGNDFARGDLSRLEALDPAATIAAGLVDPDGEFTHLTYGIAVTDADSSYEYGAGFYNLWIALFVPKLITGEEFKQALFLHVTDSGYFNNSLGWSARPTTAPTGPGSAYRQFGFLGCFYFFLVARALRILAEKARRENDVFLQTFFIILLAPAVAAMTNDIYTLYHPVFVHLPALLVARHFSRAGEHAILPVRAFPPPGTTWEHRTA